MPRRDAARVARQAHVHHARTQLQIQAPARAAHEHSTQVHTCCAPVHSRHRNTRTAPRNTTTRASAAAAPATRKSTTLDSTCTRSTHGTAQPAPGTTHARAAQQTTRDAQRTDTHDQHTHAREPPLLLSQSARLELLAPLSFPFVSRVLWFTGGRAFHSTPAAPNLNGIRALLPALASTAMPPEAPLTLRSLRPARVSRPKSPYAVGPNVLTAGAHGLTRRGDVRSRPFEHYVERHVERAPRPWLLTARCQSGVIGRGCRSRSGSGEPGGAR
jgi:hypothetical protein